ncbi:hypothetical protein [Umezawaea sp. NPDC059074]|uniref:hypothetical protein n=1 Tax=Umezawaea sp. NPDC059074 TaxID=3346716 RepID=UPI00368E6D4A
MRVDLLPSETLLWQGKPARFPLFDHWDRFVLPVLGALVLFGVLFFPTLSAERPSGLFRVFPVLWFVVLAWFVVARYGLRQLTLRSAEYAVTDQRVIVVIKPFGSTTERSAYLNALEPPVLKEHPDGLGTITFGRPSALVARGSRPAPNQVILLESIPDAAAVRDLITRNRSTPTG